MSLWFFAPVRARYPRQKGSLFTTRCSGPEAAGSVSFLSLDLVLATVGAEIPFGTWYLRDSLELSVTLKQELGC